MSAIRSARLERLLGTTTAEATYEHVASLVENAVSESFDLDFKAELYGNKNSQRRELAGDIAALANTAGGLIILGIQEDDQARASAAPGVAATDAEVNRIYQIAASNLSPLPGLDVRALPSPDGGPGFILIAVPPSPAQPHAVLVNDALRYPRRNGTTTAYLSEPEVADAYRDRFTGLQDRAEQLMRYEQDLAQTLNTEQRTFVIASLLPDRPGAMQIDARTESAFRSEILGKQPMIAGLAAKRTRVGPRRLFASTASSSEETETWVVCELHADGGGAFASVVDQRLNPDGSPRQESLIGDELVVLGILSGLRFLGRHARDRAATTGNSSVRATICPASAEVPGQLVSHRGFSNEPAGNRTVRSAPGAGTVADIDLLAEDGSGLVAAAYRLASDLVQEFGLAEAAQLTREGSLRRPYWGQSNRSQMEQWARQAGVALVDEPLPL